MQSATIGPRLTRLLVVALLAAAAIRVVASLVSGFATLASATDFPGGSARTGQVLTAFGSAGDSVEVLLLVAALVLVWRGLAVATPAQRSWLTVLAVVSAALVGCRVAGIFVFTSQFAIRAAIGQQAVVAGFGVADLVLAGTVLAGVRLLPAVEAAEGVEPTSGDDPLLFAVDRRSGEVFAFFSAAEARRTISTYSVEDDEFEFFDDEGHVVHAAVVDGWTRFATTEVDERDALLSRLRRFAADKSLEVDDLDDPLAFVRPINEWQWLELWPGWMRGIGRAVGRFRR